MPFYFKYKAFSKVFSNDFTDSFRRIFQKHKIRSGKRAQ